MTLNVPVKIPLVPVKPVADRLVVDALVIVVEVIVVVASEVVPVTPKFEVVALVTKRLVEVELVKVDEVAKTLVPMKLVEKISLKRLA